MPTPTFSGGGSECFFGGASVRLVGRFLFLFERLTDLEPLVFSRPESAGQSDSLSRPVAGLRGNRGHQTTRQSRRGGSARVFRAVVRNLPRAFGPNWCNRGILPPTGGLITVFVNLLAERCATFCCICDKRLSSNYTQGTCSAVNQVSGKCGFRQPVHGP